MIDIIKELGRPLTFKPIFDNLRQKAVLERHRLLSHPVNHDLTLEWVLRNEVQVVNTLTKQIRKHKYRPQTAQQHEILLDKTRQLFSLAWPDRIVEMALARIINQTISPSYTESLYSYRKGYGNLAAIKSLAGFIAQQHKLDKDIYLAKRDIENFGQSIMSCLSWN